MSRKKSVLNTVIYRAPWVCYPTFLWLPVLRPDSNLRLGLGFSDTNLIIRQAMILKSMRWPWSNDLWSIYPDSQVFWNVGNLINMGFNLPIWLLTRFMDPALAVNLYALGGSLLTGAIVHNILRYFRCSPMISASFAVIAQMLPWLRQYGLFGVTTTYFLALPLSTLALVLHYRRSHEIRYVWRLLLLLVALGITNPYMLFFLFT